MVAHGQGFPPLGHDPEHGYWVIKDGGIGSLLKAASPDELNQALTAREEGAGR